MKMFLIRMSICLAIISLHQLLVLAQFPLPPFNTQNKVVGTIGEERPPEGTAGAGFRGRFHRGLDLSKGVSDVPLVVIETDTLYFIGNDRNNLTVGIGNYTYTHFKVDSIKYAWYLANRNVVINSGDTLGKLNNAAHCHLQYTENGTANITSIHRDDVNWNNPRDQFDMTDTGVPYFWGTGYQGIFLRRDGGGAITQSENLLYGHLHVQCRAKQPNMEDLTGAPLARGGSAPYQLMRRLIRNNVSISERQGITFDKCPNNYYHNNPNGRYVCQKVHRPGSSYAGGNFIWDLDNDPFDKKANHDTTDVYSSYWNIKQKRFSSDSLNRYNYHIDAVCPWNALIEDNDSLRVEVKIADFSGNADSAQINQYYKVDNFKPFVRSVTVQALGTPYYSAGWDCIETDSCSGIGFYETFHAQYHRDLLTSGALEIMVVASEKLTNSYLRTSFWLLYAFFSS